MSCAGIYDGYAGWYATNPSSMYATPPSAICPDLVKLAGGADSVARLAAEKVDAGKLVEALHLTDASLAADPRNNAALKVRIQAMDLLQKDCDNFVEDGWLTYGITKAKAALPAGAAQ